MQVLGIPRSGFSLLMSSLDCIISWDWEQRARLSEINEALGRKVIKDFFNNLPKKSKTIWSGEFNTLTGGPKTLDKKYLKVRKYLGFIDHGDIVFEISLNKNLTFLNHIFHSHYFNLNDNQNIPTIITNRNPCGIFESAIHSLNAMTSEYIQLEKPDLNSTQIEELRNDMATYKFSRPDVVAALIDFQVNETKSMANFLSMTKNNIIIDWEDLILSESDAFSKVYNFVKNYNISVINYDESKKNFYTNINKNLLEFHKHNFRVGHALRDGWIYGLPNIISNNITNMIKKFDSNEVSIRNYKKHMNNLKSNKQALHEHGKLAEQVLKNKESYSPKLLDNNIKEFSMNKSNLDASNLNEDHICDLRLGLIYIKKMSKKLEFLIPAFENLNQEIKKINETVEESNYIIKNYSSNLRLNIEFGDNLIRKLN